MVFVHIGKKKTDARPANFATVAGALFFSPCCAIGPTPMVLPRARCHCSVAKNPAFLIPALFFLCAPGRVARGQRQTGVAARDSRCDLFFFLLTSHRPHDKVLFFFQKKKAPGKFRPEGARSRKAEQSRTAFVAAIMGSFSVATNRTVQYYIRCVFTRRRCAVLLASPPSFSRVVFVGTPTAHKQSGRYYVASGGGPARRPLATLFFSRIEPCAGDDPRPHTPPP